MKKTESNDGNVAEKKAQDRNKKTVYLADYCEISGKLLSSILFEEGYKIIRFNSGTELLESLLKGAYPDLLLIGMVLPGISGVELLARLNSARIKVTSVMIGQAQNMNDVLRAYSYGAVDFILKPLDLKEVLLRVRLSMERSLQSQLQAQLRPAAEIALT